MSDGLTTAPTLSPTLSPYPSAGVPAAHPRLDEAVKVAATELSKHHAQLGSKRMAFADSGLRCTCDRWAAGPDGNGLRPWDEFYAHVAQVATVASLPAMAEMMADVLDERYATEETRLRQEWNSVRVSPEDDRYLDGLDEASNQVRHIGTHGFSPS